MFCALIVVGVTCLYTYDKMAWRIHTQCTNVRVLVVILCFSYKRCNHWRKLGEGYMDLSLKSLKLLANQHFKI